MQFSMNEHREIIMRIREETCRLFMLDNVKQVRAYSLHHCLQIGVNKDEFGFIVPRGIEAVVLARLRELGEGGIPEINALIEREWSACRTS